MGFRLTVLLAAAIFLAMYFAPAPEPRPQAVVEASPPAQSIAPDPVPAAPQVAAPRTPEPVAPAAGVSRPVQPVADAPTALPPGPADNLMAEDAAADVTEQDPSEAVVPGLGLGALRPADSGDALGLVDAVRQQTGAQADRPVDLTRPETGAIAVAPLPTQGTAPLPRALVLGSAVNLRAGPSTANPVVGQVDFGDEVVVTAEDPAAGWTGIRHPQTGATVYVASRFLQIQP